jgi:MFS family permease
MISKPQHPKPSFQSIIGLTALVFFMSDVRDGVGPFLSIYLKSVLNWDTGKTGMALAAMSIAGAIMQLPSGLLVDSTKFKRLILAVSCVLISLGCLIDRRGFCDYPPFNNSHHYWPRKKKSISQAH